MPFAFKSFHSIGMNFLVAQLHYNHDKSVCTSLCISFHKLFFFGGTKLHLNIILNLCNLLRFLIQIVLNDLNITDLSLILFVKLAKNFMTNGISHD